MAAIERAGNQRIVIPVAKGELIEAGTMVAINSTGYAVTAIKMADITIAGVAERTVDNRLGEDGDTVAEVKRGAFEVANDGTIESTHILKTAYVKDAVTVTLTAEESSSVGKILQITENGVTVEIM